MINNKNAERLIAWRIRYYEATGMHANVLRHNIAPCVFCKRPVWRQASLKIPVDKHFCASSECNEKLIELIKK